MFCFECHFSVMPFSLLGVETALYSLPCSWSMLWGRTNLKIDSSYFGGRIPPMLVTPCWIAQLEIFSAVTQQISWIRPTMTIPVSVRSSRFIPTALKRPGDNRNPIPVHTGIMASVLELFKWPSLVLLKLSFKDLGRMETLETLVMESRNWRRHWQWNTVCLKLNHVIMSN